MNNDLPIFDGHNDALQSIYLPQNGKPRPFFERTDQGHTDLPRMREGGYAGGFFAVFVPSGTPDDGFPGADSESGKAASLIDKKTNEHRTSNTRTSNIE